jgi:hypothetical protein
MLTPTECVWGEAYVDQGHLRLFLNGRCPAHEHDNREAHECLENDLSNLAEFITPFANWRTSDGPEYELARTYRIEFKEIRARFNDSENEGCEVVNVQETAEIIVDLKAVSRWRRGTPAVSFIGHYETVSGEDLARSLSVLNSYNFTFVFGGKA